MSDDDDDDSDEYTKKKATEEWKIIVYEFDNRHFVLYIEPMVMLDSHFFRWFSNIEPTDWITEVNDMEKELLLPECLMS